ncbi:hypothetical protein ACVBEJ_07350 [Porticoccus sp. GXU_MW_L64]
MNEEVITAEGGIIIKLADDLAEVIVSEGMEVTAAMVDECGELLEQHFSCPCRVLINRKNSYHYNFDAQQRLADLESVSSVAVLAYNGAGEIAAKIVRMFPGKGSWRVNIFYDRRSALEWLGKKIENAP